MSIKTSLDKLSQDIDTAKNKLSTNLTSKGVTSNPSDTLDKMADDVLTIPAGGKPDWSEIGYSDTPKLITDGFEYAKQIYDTWDPNQTSLYGKFTDDKKLVYMPMVDTSNATAMNSMFNQCSLLTTIPQLDTSKVTDMNNMFYFCSSLTTIPQLSTSEVTDMSNMFNSCKSLTDVPKLDTSKVARMDWMFYSCYSLTTIPPLDISSVTNMSWMFYQCLALTSITLVGDPSKVTNTKYMFDDIRTTGTLYYDNRYDYSKIIAVLPPTWTATPIDVDGGDTPPGPDAGGGLEWGDGDDPWLG